MARRQLIPWLFVPDVLEPLEALGALLTGALPRFEQSERGSRRKHSPQRAHGLSEAKNVVVSRRRHAKLQPSRRDPSVQTQQTIEILRPNPE
jgi:hypothetical protein